jgi:hypothetical protein
MISVLRTDTGLIFPDFEEGSRLRELAESIASALGSPAYKRTGSALEILVEFDGYPKQFVLWWDGFTCELGCSRPCEVDIDAILERLQWSGRFLKA